jgi:hypothetical protein
LTCGHTPIILASPPDISGGSGTNFMRNSCSLRLAVLLLAAIAAVVPGSQSAFGFAPRNWIPLENCIFNVSIGVQVTIPLCNPLIPAYLAGHTHESITREAVRTFDLDPTEGNFAVIDPFTGIPGTTYSMEQAINEIVDADADVDLNQFIASAHFDGENFAGGQTRLLNFRQAIITALQANNPHQARINLGQAFHTIQDFYSHTNYVEMGNTTPLAQLGVPGQLIPAISALVPTCLHDPTALKDTGAGSLIAAGLNQLTSGYYGNEDRTPVFGEPKCNHGGIKDSLGFDGINKDTKAVHPLGFAFDIAPFSPTHFNYHEQAAALATQATIKFLDDLLNQPPTITEPQMAGLLGADRLVLTNTNLTSTVDVILSIDLVSIQNPVDIFLNPQEDAQFVMPDISRAGSTLILQGISSFPSITGLVGYTLTLPNGYEFVQVKSDRGTTTLLSGQTTHTDLLVLMPVSGPAHRMNTYTVRQKQ